GAGHGHRVLAFQAHVAGLAWLDDGAAFHPHHADHFAPAEHHLGTVVVAHAGHARVAAVFRVVQRQRRGDRLAGAEADRIDGLVAGQGRDGQRQAGGEKGGGNAGCHLECSLQWVRSSRRSRGDRGGGYTRRSAGRKERGVHGEYKIPGGKLVVVDLAVAGGRIANVQVSGDFFLEPPEALDAINAAVEGVPVDAGEEALTAAVAAALGPETQTFGITP